MLGPDRIRGCSMNGQCETRSGAAPAVHDKPRTSGNDTDPVCARARFPLQAAPVSKRLTDKLAALKAEGRAGLVPFFSVGDPDLQTSRDAILAACEAGADVIEL